MMDRLDALERLARLKQQGMLTDEEFAAEKARLLARGNPDPSGARNGAAIPTGADATPMEPVSHYHDRHFIVGAHAAGDGSSSFEHAGTVDEPAIGDAPGGSIWPKVAVGVLAVMTVVGAAVWFGRSEVAPDRPAPQVARKPSASAAPSGSPELSPQEAQRRAFVAAFGYAPPSAKSLADHEDDDDDNGLFSPVALIPVGSHLAVVAVHQGPSYHAAPGALAVRYVDRSGDDFRRLSAAEVDVKTGSFGSIAGWKLRRDLAAEPVIAVEGGGTWQGCTGAWTDLIALTPSAPVLLAKGIPTSLSHEGEDDADRDTPYGDFVATLTRSGDDILVRYAGDDVRTLRYARNGDRLVPDSEPPPSC